MTSYFEIGGYIVECSTIAQSSLPKPRISSFSHVKRLSSPPAGVRRRTPDRRPEPDDSTLKSNQIKRMIGSTMIRTGVAILLVPDPIPVIDEVVGAGLVYGGAYVMSTAE